MSSLPNSKCSVVKSSRFGGKSKFLVLEYLGHWKRKWYVLSNPPHMQEGLGTIFFRKRWEFRELHSILNLACSIWPFLEPTLKYLGGVYLFLFRRNLKEETVGDFFVSSGRSFQARIDEGRKELKNRLVFALGFLMSLEFLSVQRWFEDRAHNMKKKNCVQWRLYNEARPEFGLRIASIVDIESASTDQSRGAHYAIQGTILEN